MNQSDFVSIGVTSRTREKLRKLIAEYQKMTPQVKTKITVNAVVEGLLDKELDRLKPMG